LSLFLSTKRAQASNDITVSKAHTVRRPRVRACLTPDRSSMGSAAGHLHGYPPDQQERAVETVLRQAASVAGAWAA